jgi:hypothetical protein
MALERAGAVDDKTGAGMRRAEGAMDAISRGARDPNQLQAAFFQSGMQNLAAQNKDLAAIMRDPGRAQLLMQTAPSTEGYMEAGRAAGINITEKRARELTAMQMRQEQIAAQQTDQSTGSYFEKMALDASGGVGAEAFKRLRQLRAKGPSQEDLIGMQMPQFGPPVPAPSIQDRAGPGGAMMAEQALRSLTDVGLGMGTLNTQLKGLTDGIVQYTERVNQQIAALGASGMASSPTRMTVSTGAAPSNPGANRGQPPGKTK